MFIKWQKQNYLPASLLDLAALEGDVHAGVARGVEDVEGLGVGGLLGRGHCEAELVVNNGVDLA